MKISDYIYKTLIKHNITQICSVVGGGSMYLNNSMKNNKYFNCTFFHHEQAAAMACDAYSRLTNKVACLTITSGPGVLNALNGVMGAQGDSLGMLVISGNMQRDMLIKNNPGGVRTFGDQEVDVENIVKPMVKCFIRLDDVNTFKIQLEYAIYVCNSGRKGVCWIDVPLDIQKQEIDEEAVDKQKLLDMPKDEWNVSNKDIRTIKNLIQSSKKPVVLAGAGIRLSDGLKEFKALVEKLNIPVITAFNAYDVLDHEHRLNVGKVGTIGEGRGNIVSQNSDLMLILGSRMEIRTIGYGYEKFAKDALKIMVDIDKAELNKRTLNIDKKIESDLKFFMNKMLENTKEPLAEKKEWVDWCCGLKKKYQVLQEKHSATEELNPYLFYSKLSDALGKDDIIVTSNGGASVIGSQCIKIRDGQRFFTNGSMGSMGYGICASIGASIGSGDKRVICYEGDGSIMMSLHELSTVKHLNKNIKIFVLNNSGYSSIRQTQNNYFKGNYVGCDEKDLSFPDFRKIADAFDIKYVCITKENLDYGIEESLDKEYKYPVLIEVEVEKDYIFEPKGINYSPDEKYDIIKKEGENK